MCISEKSFNAMEYKTVLDKTMRIEDAPKVPLPLCGDHNYIFVSYSHKDYKEVYADLADLYEAGVCFWYDEGLTPGKSWKEMVSQKLKDSRCVGVIFYMSKNLYISESIFFEISHTANFSETDAETYTIGKRYFGVNLDTELPATAIISAAFSLKSDKDKENIILKLPKLAKTFSNERTYIPYNSKEHIKDVIKALKDFENVIDEERARESLLHKSKDPYESFVKGLVIDGKYEIQAEIGQGGMSRVYRAWNRRLNAPCAIKAVRFDNISSELGRAMREAAERECYFMKRFNYAGLPRVLDIIETETSILIIMEYIEGVTLKKLLDIKGARPEEKVVDWAKQLCGILNYLHTRKPPIIYRDMKPANVFLKPDGTLTLVDFGIAREYREGLLCDETCVGTVPYAAPEQFGGMGQTDARTDIYALGITLYYLVTGFNPAEPKYTVYRPIREINPNLSRRLEKIILKCTRLNPSERYQTAKELLLDLEKIKIADRKARSMSDSEVRMSDSEVSQWDSINWSKVENDKESFRINWSDDTTILV